MSHMQHAAFAHAKSHLKGIQKSMSRAFGGVKRMRLKSQGNETSAHELHVSDESKSMGEARFLIIKCTERKKLNFNANFELIQIFLCMMAQLRFEMPIFPQSSFALSRFCANQESELCKKLFCVASGGCNRKDCAMMLRTANFL